MQVQQTATTYKLPERNVVEIIMKLIETGKIEVIFTQNGREYVTPKQLEREIKDEIMLHKGTHVPLINLINHTYF